MQEDAAQTNGHAYAGSESEIDLSLEVARLARLSALDYERIRESEAQRLRVRMSALDRIIAEARKTDSRYAQKSYSLNDIEPWPDPVDGAALLHQLSALLQNYIILNLDEETGDCPSAYAMALWAVHAHAHDAFHTSPLLAIESPQKRCGKTRVIEILQHLTPRAIMTANVTPSALFRIIERDKPTLFIDEGDTFLKANEEMRGILNSGHTRSSAYVLRTVEIKGELEPRQFSTWAPKAIALIGDLPSTLQDRSVVIQLRRKRKGEQVARFRTDRAGAMLTLNRQAARWAADHKEALMTADPVPPDALHDRAADNWRPLLAIADRAGADWPEMARDAARALSSDDGDSDQQEAGIRLLADCKAIFEEKAVEALQPQQLVIALQQIEESPWSEWRHGRPVTARSVARLLKPFGIKSCEPTRAFSGEKRRFYARRDFEDAWSRYLSSMAE
jgi:putative DNA primase/helicase